MEAPNTIENSSGNPSSIVQDETHEAAMRIARERQERDRRLREVERQSRASVPHELHTSIGD